MEDKTCNLGFLACNAGDLGLITESESSPGDENGNPLQYSCLGNPMDRGAWWTIQSMGLQRVSRDLVTKQQQCIGYSGVGETEAV